MKQGVTYRGYTLHHDGTEYVAEPTCKDGEILEIGAARLETLYLSIDELWSHLALAESILQPVIVPAWYQAWLDDGASGRVRIHDSGRYESIAPRRRWWGAGKIMAGALVCLAAAVSIPRLDVNGDGSIDMDDYSALVEKAFLARPPKNSHQRIRLDKRIYDVMLTPAPDADVDFDAKDIQIGVSVKQAVSSVAVE